VSAVHLIRLGPCTVRTGVNSSHLRGQTHETSHKLNYKDTSRDCRAVLEQNACTQLSVQDYSKGDKCYLSSDELVTE
jgi:hypothetical protein